MFACAHFLSSFYFIFFRRSIANDLFFSRVKFRADIARNRCDRNASVHSEMRRRWRRYRWHAKWRRVTTSRWFLYRCRICGAFRKRSRGARCTPTHRIASRRPTSRPARNRPSPKGVPTDLTRLYYFLAGGAPNCGRDSLRKTPHTRNRCGGFSSCGKPSRCIQISA